MILSTIRVVRSGITHKFFNVPIWVYQDIRFSKRLPSANFKSSCRLYSQQRNEKSSSALTESKTGGSEISTATVFETVKETTKTAGNLGVILLGFGILGAILWTISKELFSGNSPNSIYSSALDRCISDPRVQDHLGQPIKAFGEENRRGRRRHVSHSIYEVEGRKHMFLKFYIQGTRKRGTVYVEMKEDDRGNFQRNLLAIELDDLLRTKVIIEDNRQVNAIQNNELPTFS